MLRWRHSLDVVVRFLMLKQSRKKWLERFSDPFPALDDGGGGPGDEAAEDLFVNLHGVVSAVAFLKIMPMIILFELRRAGQADLHFFWWNLNFLTQVAGLTRPFHALTSCRNRSQ